MDEDLNKSLKSEVEQLGNRIKLKISPDRQGKFEVKTIQKNKVTIISGS